MFLADASRPVPLPVSSGSEPSEASSKRLPTMNGFERIDAALHGRWPDQTPIMLHNFMMAAREAGMTQQQYRSSPRNIADAHLRAIETYGTDGIVLDVDTATLAEAVGVPVDHPLGRAGALPPRLPG